MKAWQVGFVLSALCGGLGLSAPSLAPAMAPPSASVPHGPITPPRAPEPEIVVPAPETVRGNAAAPRVEMPVRATILVLGQSPVTDPPVIIRPARRSGFERLRRALPYGVAHDPVIRYLTDEEFEG